VALALCHNGNQPPFNTSERARERPLPGERVRGENDRNGREPVAAARRTHGLLGHPTEPIECPWGGIPLSAKAIRRGITWTFRLTSMIILVRRRKFKENNELVYLLV
jgi:hypothetical protein